MIIIANIDLLFSFILAQLWMSVPNLLTTGVELCAADQWDYGPGGGKWGRRNLLLYKARTGHTLVTSDIVSTARIAVTRHPTSNAGVVDLVDNLFITGPAFGVLPDCL